MAVRTVGAGGDYAFTEAGITAAIAACSGGDTVRIIQAGTITLTTALAPTAAITIEGDISLYTGYDKTTLPKLFTAGSTRAIAMWVNGVSVKNLQFEGFNITSSGNAGGAINGQGYTVGTLQNLYFTSCVTCIQQCVGGTFRDIRAIDVGRLMRSSTGPDFAVFEVKQYAGYDYIFDNGSDTTGTYALGAVYQDGSRVNHSVANVSGTGPTFRNISAYRAAGAGGTAFKGTFSYCTQTGYGTLGSGTDAGNNYTRDPLFVAPAAGSFGFQVTSLEIDSGTAISGVTTDMEGQTLPVGSGWPRGSRDLLLSTTVSTVTMPSSTSVKLTLAALVTNNSSWTTVGNFTITPPGGAPAISISSAAVTDAGMSITLTTSEHLQGGSYNVAWAGLLNVTDGNMGYTGVGTAPTLVSASFNLANRVVLTFSEDMTNDAALTTLTNYTITDVTGGDLIIKTVAQRISATVVWITVSTNSPFIGGRVYRFGASNVTDLAGNTVSAATVDATRTSIVRDLTAAYAYGVYQTVEIEFDAPVDPSVSDVELAATYVFTRQSPLLAGSTTPTIVSVDCPNPSDTVTLLVRGMSLGQNYRCAIAATAANDSSNQDFVGVDATRKVAITGAIPRGTWGGET